MSEDITQAGERTKTLDNIIQGRAGGKTERCHGIPHQGSYSVAAHSWGVALLMFQLWPEDFPRLAIYCLTHDNPEFWAGDIPSPTIRYVPGLKASLGSIEDDLNRQAGLPAEGDLPHEDYMKLKVCDWFEFFLWSREQILMGNRYAQEGLNEVTRHLNDQALPFPAAWYWNKLRDMSDDSLLPRQAGVMQKVCK